ncbi:hypothetical protein WJX81_008181 [Elliptochloris bilobata]|uniref:Glycosyl transferase family 28 C-terminal domain-containing protein n=1 Tax=Elliptochloris bilobata TaxID=381761 RepID=A0AAW1SJI4_9CHLO
MPPAVTRARSEGAAAAPAGGGGGTVLVTVGTTRFDALVRAVDDPAVAEALAASGFTELVIQVGAGEYRPQRLLPPDAPGRAGMAAGGLRVSWFEFLPSLAERMAAADLVISHAGSGSVFEALAASKALIAVPNAALMANHQAELAGALAGMRHCFTTPPERLLATLQRMDLSTLAPYPKGDPAAIVQEIDRLVGI